MLTESDPQWSSFYVPYFPVNPQISVKFSKACPTRWMSTTQNQVKIDTWRDGRDQLLEWKETAF
jgi:hypothetical protein